MASSKRNYPALISEYQASGLVVKDFCRKKNIALSTFQYHLYKKEKPTPTTVSTDFVALKPAVVDWDRKLRIQIPGGIEIVVALP